MEQSEIEVLVGELETRMDRLRALYDQYFMGIERLEPLVPRKDVERRMAVLRREQIRNTGLRYKFNVVIQRFNTYQTYWLRIARQIEQGTYRRDVIRAAARFGVDPARERAAAAQAEPPTNPAARVIPEDVEELEDGSAFLEPLDAGDAPIDSKGENAGGLSSRPPMAAKAYPAMAPPPEEEFDIQVELDDLAAPFEEHDPFPRPATPAVPYAPTAAAPKLRIAPRPGATSVPSGDPTSDERRETERRMPAASIAAPRIAPRTVIPGAGGGSPGTVAPPPTARGNVIIAKRSPSTVSPDELAAAPPAPAPSGPSLQRPTTLPGAVPVQRPTNLPAAAPASPTLQRPTTLPGAVPVQRPTTLPGAVPVQRPTAVPGAAPPQRPTAVPGAAPAPRPTNVPAAAPPPPSLQRPATLAGTGPALQRPTTLPGAVPINPPLQRPTTMPGAVRPTAVPGPVAINPPLQRPPTLPGAGPANASNARTPPPPTPPRPPPPSAAAPTPPPPQRAIVPPPAPATARVGDLSADRFGQIFTKYVETRKERNEPTHAITREALAKQLGESTARLREKHGGKAIDFEVVVKDGKTILRPVVK